MLLMVIVLSIKLLGFIKQSILAWAFGTSPGIDVYYTADGYVSMFGQVILAAIPPAIITTYLKIKNSEEEKKFICSSFILMGIIGLILSLANILLSPFLSRILGPSYNLDQINKLTYYLILLSPLIIFASVASISSGLLQSKHKFLQDKLYGLYSSVFIIISVFTFKDTLGVDSLPIGYIIGYFAFALMMVILFFRNTKFVPSSPINNNNIKKFKKAVLPIIVGVCLVDISHLLDRIIASTLEPGSVSSLYYSQIICGDLVNGIIITSIGTVLLPDFAKKIANNGGKTAINLRRIFGVTIPIVLLITLLYIIVGDKFISVVFERGEFTSQSTEIVYSCVAGYAIGLVAILIKEIISKYFYAIEDTKTPMKANIVGIVLNVALNIVLSHFLGVQGIAYATSFSLAFACIILIINYKRVANTKILNKKTIREMLKLMSAALVTIFVGLLSTMLNIDNKWLSLFVQSILIISSFTILLFVFKTETCKYVKYIISKSRAK
ncbi:polysaccharide biosynthesis C-terminal domain-containing protein [Candidatus Saccharibacteria bacterium]|nr:polysaccharide biosynthesis C-terminal domain-containing protein [Candidatus Saccharibacteria bacterium]